MADRRRTLEPRRWTRRWGSRDHLQTRMGPLSVRVMRWTAWTGTNVDNWGYEVFIGDVRIMRGHHKRRGAPLAKCQADAIAAVERWRDAIR